VLRKNAFFILALLALWLTGANGCVIAAAFPGDVAAPCECGEAHEEERGCGTDCAPCVTLESGVNLGSLTPVAVPPPTWTELKRLLLVELAKAQEKAGESAIDVATSPPPVVRSVWRVFVGKALPVRGPSSIA
jgi:hypothetical protein